MSAGQKGPTAPGWQDLRLETKEDLRSGFDEDSNRGRLLGTLSGGLVDIDLDDPLIAHLAHDPL